MSFNTQDLPMTLGILLGSLFLIVALCLAFLRAYQGPTPFDRIVALELVGGICLCAIVLCAIKFDQAILLEAAFAIALVSFLGTVVFARYLGEQDT